MGAFLSQDQSNGISIGTITILVKFAKINPRKNYPERTAKVFPKILGNLQGCTIIGQKFAGQNFCPLAKISPHLSEHFFQSIICKDFPDNIIAGQTFRPLAEMSSLLSENFFKSIVCKDFA